MNTPSFAPRFVRRCRFLVPRLPDAELSGFISMSVVKGGMIVGFGQILFLAFSSIQCLSEAEVEAENACKKKPDACGGNSWRSCKRSLFR